MDLQLGQNDSLSGGTLILTDATSCMHACVTLYHFIVRGRAETRAVIIVITEAAIFKLEVLSASSSEVCLLCFAVYSFRIFSFTQIVSIGCNSP